MTALRLIALLGLSGCWLAPARAPVDVVDRDGDGDPAASDCDDRDGSLSSSAAEVCDGIDNDCDGLIDERVTQTGFVDADGDGFGGDEITACELPANAVSVGGDCDDGDPDTWPGAPENCGTVDRDCDGAVSTTGGPWYEDADLDGFGNPLNASFACTAPTGFIASAADCDDSDPTIHPGAAELCDGLDRDCDGQPSPLGGPWHADVDGDGYGTPLVVDTSCVAPASFVADATDCDDGNAAVNPGAAELCNGIDDNCAPADDLLDGSSATCAVDHCAELQLLRPTAPDGVYWIDPAGTGALTAWCDMTREGGGWTLVYAYTFTEYTYFTAAANAVSPIPSWPITLWDQPISNSPPQSELDFNAMEHALWSSVGSEFFSVSTIQDWVVCTEGAGSLSGPTAGAVSCANVNDVATACSGVTPTAVNFYSYGWALTAGSLFTYWDGYSLANWPTHDPCGLNQANQLTGSADPRGALYFR